MDYDNFNDEKIIESALRLGLRIHKKFDTSREKLEVALAQFKFSQNPWSRQRIFQRVPPPFI